MNAHRIIKEMFPEKSQLELSQIWFQVFDTELSAMFGAKAWIDPIKLDEIYQKEYGEYEGSFRDDVIKRFGQDLLAELIN
jgi:bisphosphoglycerate-dependent phosphoglycerate mutase